MRRRPLLFLLFVGAIWFGAWSLIIANHWSGQDVTSRDYLLWNEFPKDWAATHPDCRNRFAFWPDGTPMDADTLSPYNETLLEMAAPPNRMRSPEEVAKDNWARGVRQKIASCEEAEWLPIAKANAIANEQIELLAGAFLPLLILLAGATLMLRGKGVVLIIGKAILSIGFFIAAGEVVVLVFGASDAFNNYIVGQSLYHPLVNGPGWGVICALVIPISIALWWPKPLAFSKRLDACSVGIAVPFIPILVQIISWPFMYRSGNGVWASGGVTVFACIVLATVVTRRLIGASSVVIVPAHVRKGLLRLYLVLIIPWIASFGYIVHRENHALKFYFSEIVYVDSQLSVLNDPSSSSAAKANAEHELMVPSVTWNARSDNEIIDKIQASADRAYRELDLAIYALLTGFAPALLYPIVLWLIAGFRTSLPETTNVSQGSQSSSFRK